LKHRAVTVRVHDAHFETHCLLSLLHVTRSEVNGCLFGAVCTCSSRTFSPSVKLMLALTDDGPGETSNVWHPLTALHTVQCASAT